MIPSFQDRIESQEELFQLLENFFQEKDSIDYKTFLYNIENISSEIYIYILAFLLEKKPFSKSNVIQYEKQIKSLTSSNFHSFLNGNNFNYFVDKANSLFNKKTKYIQSPNLHSKLSPSIILSKSPAIRKISRDFPSDKFDLKLNLSDNNKNNLSFLDLKNSIFIKSNKQINSTIMESPRENIKFDFNQQGNFEKQKISYEKNNIPENNNLISQNNLNHTNISLNFQKNFPILNYSGFHFSKKTNPNSPIKKKIEKSVPVKNRNHKSISSTPFSLINSINNNNISDKQNLNLGNNINISGNIGNNYNSSSNSNLMSVKNQNVPKNIFEYDQVSPGFKNMNNNNLKKNFFVNNSNIENITNNNNLNSYNWNNFSDKDTKKLDTYRPIQPKNIINSFKSLNELDSKQDLNTSSKKIVENKSFSNANIIKEDIDLDDSDEGEIIKMKGYLFKLTDVNKMKKLWFDLIQRDLYCKIIFF